MLENENHSHLQYVEERLDSKNIRVRGETKKKEQMMVAERKSKIENNLDRCRGRWRRNRLQVHIPYHKYT